MVKKDLPRKLNIGCGKDIRKGYYNVDLIKFKGVDAQLNLDEFPYDLPSEYFDEIICKSVLQCVENPGKVIEEFYRLLRKGGKLVFDVPHFTSKNVWKDITHRRGFTYHSFEIFMDNDYYVSGVKAQFSKSRKKLSFGKKFAVWNYIIEPIANRWPNLYEDTPLRMFPAMNIYIEFVK